MWVPIVLGAAGALQGANNQKKMKQNDAFRKASIQYSPWTNMGDPGAQQLPGALEGAIKGAAGGMSITGGAGFGGGSGGGTPGAGSINTAATENAAQGALGNYKFETPQLAQMQQTDMSQAVTQAADGFQPPQMLAQKGSPGAMGQWSMIKKKTGSY